MWAYTGSWGERRGARLSDGAHRDGGEVIEQADFFLHKRFGVSDAGEQAVEAGHGFGARADFGLEGEEAGAFGLIVILRAVGHERLEAAFEMRSDIDDEGGAHVVVEAGVEDFEGAVRASDG